MKKISCLRFCMVMGLFISLINEVKAADIEAVLDDNAGASEFVVKDSDSTQVLGVSSDGDISLVDIPATEDPWIGLGESAGKIEFDDQTTDEINLLNCNVGIGTTTPNSKLEVAGDTRIGYNELYLLPLGGSVATDSQAGVYWHDVAGGTNIYGIYRTPGTWTASTYQQGKWRWPTGIILQPGPDASDGYDKSYVEIGGGGKGLMVTYGNVGIGTTTPEGKLDVRGNLVLEKGGNPVIYGGTGEAELNRYLMLLNSPGHTTALGLKVGGVLVSDSYGYADPNKNDLIVKGNVGIGTAPSVKLHVDESDLAKSGILFKVATTNSSYYALDVQSAGTSRLYVRADGNVGIGTTNPGSLLQIYGSGGDTKGIRLMSTGTNNPMTYIYPGIATPDAGFITFGDGSGWKFHIGKRSDVGATKFITIQDNGNVGIGTTSPAGKLDVNGTIYQRGSLLHADYVFEPEYELESIDEHAAYMWENKHLKAVPKARKDESGQDMVEWGERSRGILEELEKAHVYIQQLNERIKVLEMKLSKLET